MWKHVPDTTATSVFSSQQTHTNTHLLFFPPHTGRWWRTFHLFYFYYITLTTEGEKKKLIQCFVFFLWKKPNYLPREFEFNWGNKWQTSGNRWADFNLKCCLLFQEMCLMSQLDVLLFKECGGWSLFFRVFPKPKTTRAKVKGLDSVVWLTVPTSATVVGMFSKLA